ncbi:MAG: hypothetical protein DWG80_05850 [Chloroflexi bacterium]|nr:hypothetical protein [Chloroflexota bacterium]
MPECRRRIDLSDFDAVPVPPAQPGGEPCLHFIAAYGGARGPLAEAVLFALTGNREFLHRSLRPPEVSATRIHEVRAELDRVARSAAHEVRPDDGGDETDEAALFGDRHEAAQVAREFAHFILGPDPILGGGFR